MSDHWLSIVEYARRHNISDMTVRRRIKSGRLHAVLREGKYYIPDRGEQLALREANRPVPQHLQGLQRQPSDQSAAFGARVEGQQYHRPLTAERFGRSPADEAYPQLPGTDSVVRDSSPRHMVPPVPRPLNVSGSVVGPGTGQPQHHAHANRMNQLIPPRPPLDRDEPQPGQGLRQGDFQPPLHSLVIPRDLSQQVQQKPTALVETRSLLAFCDQTLKKLQGRERRTEELYQQRIKTMEAQFEAKELEIKLLKEQVEDLELLVKVLERKPVSAA